SLHGATSTSRAASPATDPAWNHSSALSDHYTPAIPAASSSSQAIPEDWDRTSFNKSKLQPAPPQPKPSRRPIAPGSTPAGAAASGASAFDWEAFLQAAGIDPATMPPDTSAVLGHIMRSVVQGLIEVLRARS